ncbi:hypothetical protein [Oceanicola sp. 22II-s10i]|uniref:hypothetical protein n=1 Tax=Oceanicola sp. 22II-s10i TaxID=1317116 RepID=UPI0011319DDD|nr:hypothetical protein [Oceanicola sp. 22II-s10i]
MLHLSELVLRVVAGQVPHMDFMTPIGDLAFRPIAALLMLPDRIAALPPLGLGRAMLWSQVMAAVVLLPAVCWTGLSRMRFGPAVVFGLLTLGLVTGLVFGGVHTNLSLSMHYNRWAWALTFLVVVLVVVPAGRRRADLFDGLVIGLALSALVLIKATYAVALALPVTLGLLIQFRARVMWVAGLAALAVWGLYAWAFGPEFWRAYADDLLTVLRSGIRPFPGETLQAVALSPAYTFATLAGLAAALLLRRESRGPGLALMLFLPAFVYISYQNYGNDPLWLVPVAFCLIAQLPGPGEGPRSAMAAVALTALVLVAPQMGNVLYSPVRHALLPASQYRPLLPDPAHADLRMLAARGEAPFVQATMVLPGQTPDLPEFQGRPLAECKREGGLVPVIEAETALLAELGITQGPQPFVADFLAPYWMYSALTPLPDGAPWYYDGLPGLETATHLMVPVCASKPHVRAHILSLIEARGVPLTETGHNELFTLYEIGR